MTFGFVAINNETTPNPCYYPVVKIILEKHYRWPTRTVLRVEGNPEEVAEAYDWVTANRRSLRASPFWIRGLMGWCEIDNGAVEFVRNKWL